MRSKLVFSLILTMVLLLGVTLVALGCPKPVVTAISPATGMDNEIVNVTIDGAKFHKSAQIKLTKNGETDIPAANVSITKKKITCAFDLKGKTPGAWNLVVSNIGTFTKKPKPAALNGAFTIVAVPIAAPSKEENEAVTIVENVVEPDVETPEQDTEIAEEIEEEEVEEVDPNNELVSIFFDFDQHNIRQDQRGAVLKDVEVLKEYAIDGFVIIGGHADERGPNDYNIQLSAKRAETVKNYLVFQGIEAEKIVIYAYGEENPIQTGNDEESWSYNRRVDIAIWESIPSQNEALKE